MALDPIISALNSVSNIIECTFDHDSETNERVDEPGEYSGAGIVEMFSNIELQNDDATEAAVGLFGTRSGDQTEAA